MLTKYLKTLTISTLWQVRLSLLDLYFCTSVLLGKDFLRLHSHKKFFSKSIKVQKYQVCNGWISLGIKRASRGFLVNTGEHLGDRNERIEI
jgi:hypothetical protein